MGMTPAAAKVRVKATITVDPGVHARVFIDNVDVSAGNQVDLDPGKHFASWTLMGPSGGKFSLAIDPVAGGPTIRKESDVIPPDMAFGAGHSRPPFTV